MKKIQRFSSNTFRHLLSENQIKLLKELSKGNTVIQARQSGKSYLEKIIRAYLLDSLNEESMDAINDKVDEYNRLNKILGE